MRTEKVDRQTVITYVERPVHKWLKGHAFETDTPMAELVRRAINHTYGSEPGFPAQPQARE